VRAPVRFWRTLARYLGLFASEAAKNVAKVPGWVPLAAVCFALSHLLLPDKLTILGDTVATPREVIAFLATALLYAIGDAIDETFFEDFTERWPPSLRRARIAVRKRLRIRSGIYRVSLNAVSAAGSYEGTRIQLKNEVAKFARSLIFPALVGSFLFALKTDLPGIVIGLSVSAAFAAAYLWLKIDHIRDIYDLVVRGVVSDHRFSVHELPNGVRMFFWEGKFIASGKSRFVS
jgi:hypothetical protein